MADSDGKIVYIALSTDFLHPGHMRIVEEARKLGNVIAGLLTDDAIASYKRLPVLTWDERKKIVENIAGISKVVPQRTLDYEDNLRKHKPHFVVHGPDWKQGPQRKTREKVISVLKEWNGELVEPPHIEGYDDRMIQSAIQNFDVGPTMRLRRMRRLLDSQQVSRFIEVHNGLSALIAEKTRAEVDGLEHEFDGVWVSSLTDSTAKGKPDTELVDFTSRLQTIHDVLEATSKPIILDGDTGGLPEHFGFTVSTLERLGVSAIIIEDKIGPKKNSLFGTEVVQTQDSIENFSQKITIGKRSQVGEDFMIIARIESLILEQGHEDAIKRAKAYIKAGADAIMIHSKSKDGQEVLDFLEEYKTFGDVPIVVVPTTYDHLTFEELSEAGADVIIYANHLLRSAYPAMARAAKSILKNGRAKEARKDHCMDLREILELIPNGS